MKEVEQPQAKRDAVLLAALSEIAPHRARRALGRHPRAAALLARFESGAGTSLAALLRSPMCAAIPGAHELPAVAAKAIGRGEALRHWMTVRRSNALTRLSVLEGQAAESWRRLVRFHGAKRVRVLEIVGEEVFARALRLESQRTAVAWLEPLGGTIGRRVVDRAVKVIGQRVDRAILKRWHDACTSMRSYRDRRATMRIGLGVAADLLVDAEESLRDCVIALAPELSGDSAKIGLLGGIPAKEIAMRMLTAALDESTAID